LIPKATAINADAWPNPLELHSIFAPINEDQHTVISFVGFLEHHLPKAMSNDVFQVPFKGLIHRRLTFLEVTTQTCKSHYSLKSKTSSLKT